MRTYYITHFVHADTIIPGGVQGLDRYAYVSNNPVVYNDPSGHSEECGLGEQNCRAGKIVKTPPPPIRATPTVAATPTFPLPIVSGSSSTPSLCMGIPCLPTATPRPSLTPTPTTTPSSAQQAAEEACQCNLPPLPEDDGTVLGFTVGQSEILTGVKEIAGLEIVNANNDETWALYKTHAYGSGFGKSIELPFSIGPAWGIETATGNDGLFTTEGVTFFVIQITLSSSGESGSLTFGPAFGFSYSHTDGYSEQVFP